MVQNLNHILDMRVEPAPLNEKVGTLAKSGKD
jgi:hypothetical protein